MDIESHFTILLNKYDLNYLYNKFLLLSITTSVIRDGFYWTLIFLSEMLKNNPDQVRKYSIILLCLLGLHIPVERYFKKTKAELLEKLKISNTHYFNDRMIRMSKDVLLGFDLVEYFNILDHLNDNIDDYVNNIKIKYDIPIRCITIIVIAINKKYGLLIGLLAVFYAIVKSLNEHKLIAEIDLTKQFFQQENTIRKYLVNGKNFIINNEFNSKYLMDNYTKFEKIGTGITELNDVLDFKSNIIMFSMFIIIIMNKVKDITPFDFLYYFLIIYDVEFIADIIQNYYKKKVNYTKMKERLEYLNSFKPTDQYVNTLNEKLDHITIKSIKNEKPKIILTEPINIKMGDHVLISGESGSGKTSLLYSLKGIVKPDSIDIEPNIGLVNIESYLTLPNHKSLFSGNLHDIVTNYDENPKLDIIEEALKSAQIKHLFLSNQYVDIEKLSGGERIRLLIARLIYGVKTRNYSVLLFDEIDENLNDEMALEIAKNLKDIFKNKIIIYVTHNEKVKSLFDIKYNVVNGLVQKV